MDAAAQAPGGGARLQELLQGRLGRGQAHLPLVARLSVSRVTEAGEELVAIDVTGNAFLHNMVRTIAGTLVEVGRGHRDAAWVARVLEARDRTAAGPCAPSKGLTFVGVEYPENL